jgi:hypothetical protein
MAEEMKGQLADALFDDLPSLSHDQTEILLSLFTKRQTDDSHSLHIRRIIVDKGIVQLFCFSPCCVSVVPRVWIPRSLTDISFRENQYNPMTKITCNYDSLCSKGRHPTSSRRCGSWTKILSQRPL